jgi:Rod binding domain-containing protein
MNPTASLAADGRNLDALKGRAARDPEGAVKEAARQFETLFMQEVMKRMRAASLDSGLLDNEMTKLGTEMLDQQYAQAMSGLPGGLSAAIERQLRGGLQPRTASPRCRWAAPSCPPPSRCPTWPARTCRSTPHAFCFSTTPPPRRCRRRPASRPPSCWRRPRTRPAGAAPP